MEQEALSHSLIDPKSMNDLVLWSVLIKRNQQVQSPQTAEECHYIVFQRVLSFARSMAVLSCKAR